MHIRFKSEYLSYSVPRNMTFFDNVTVDLYNFVNVKKKNLGLFVCCYLKTLFQLGWLNVNRRMGRRCENDRE